MTGGKCMNIRLTLLIVLMIVSPLFIRGQSEDDEFNVMVIYSLLDEKLAIEEAFTEDNLDIGDVNLDFQLIDDFNKVLDDYDTFILTSSIDFSLNGEQEDLIINFSNMQNKSMLIFSPYIEEFRDSTLSTIFGIEDSDSIYNEDSSDANWNLTLNTDIDSLSKDTIISYNGAFGVFTPEPGIETIASISSSETNKSDIEELQYPLPAIINASNNYNQVIVSSLSPFEVPNKIHLELRAVPIFNSLINTIISIIMLNQVMINQGIAATDNPEVTSSSTEETGYPINIKLPENIDPIQFVIIMLGLLALLLINKIKSAIRWLIDRFFFGIIFVVGAFYNIQDRIIDHNDVFLNQTRTDIMEYLEKLTYYGAHLREIKSVLGTGTGSLLWHLQILEEFGWITQIRVGRFTVFLPTEFLDDFDLELKTMELKLQSKHTLIILETLLEVSSSRLSFNVFVEETGINKKSARRLLRVLEGFELVELVKQKVLEILIVDRDILMELLTSFETRNEFKMRQTSINVKNLR